MRSSKVESDYLLFKPINEFKRNGFALCESCGSRVHATEDGLKTHMRRNHGMKVPRK